MKQLIVILALAMVGKVGLAENATVEPARTNPLIEFGVNLGTPAGVNLSAGVWGTAKVPLVLRATGMYFGSRLKGVQGDVGLLFNPDGNYKHYVALSGTTLSGGSALDSFSWTGIGPSYGFNFYGFTTQLGLSFGKSSLRSVKRYSSPQLQFQIGYSFLF